MTTTQVKSQRKNNHKKKKTTHRWRRKAVVELLAPAACPTDVFLVARCRLSPILTVVKGNCRCEKNSHLKAVLYTGVDGIRVFQGAMRSADLQQRDRHKRIAEMDWLVFSNDMEWMQGWMNGWRVPQTS